MDIISKKLTELFDVEKDPVKKIVLLASRVETIRKRIDQIHQDENKTMTIHENSNETSNEEKEVKDNPTLQESIMNVWSQGAEEQEQREDEAKWLKTEEKKSLNEEKIKCPNCGHMNDAGADKCANCGYDLSKKEGKHEKKKTMTGSPATKVDVKPEVDIDGK